jgi:hypothetical protein
MRKCVPTEGRYITVVAFDVPAKRPRGELVMANPYLEQLETDPEWINRDADWSNRAAYYVVEELVLTQLLSPDREGLARHLVAKELHELLTSGVRPRGP